MVYAALPLAMPFQESFWTPGHLHWSFLINVNKLSITIQKMAFVPSVERGMPPGGEVVRPYPAAIRLSDDARGCRTIAVCEGLPRRRCRRQTTGILVR